MASPIATLPNGLLQQQRHTSLHPRDSLGFWPTATLPNGLLKQQRHMSLHSRDSLGLHGQQHSISTYSNECDFPREYATVCTHFYKPCQIGSYHNRISSASSLGSSPKARFLHTHLSNREGLIPSKKRSKTMPTLSWLKEDLVAPFKLRRVPFGNKSVGRYCTFFLWCSWQLFGEMILYYKQLEKR